MNKVHLNFDWNSVELINKLNQNNKSNLENGVIDLWALELWARTQQLDTVDSSIDREIVKSIVKNLEIDQKSPSQD